MKIEKISDSAVKITLTSQDMLKLNIKFQNFSPENPKSNEMFWNLIKLASKETGITFENCRLTIEVMQKDMSSTVVYITKSEKTSSGVKRYKYKPKTEQNEENQAVIIFAFENFDNVCRFAKNNLYFCLLFDGNNSLYKTNGEYRLVINVPNALRGYTKKFNASVCEYGKKIRHAELFASYLAEHAKPLIASNALKILYNNF